MLAAQNDRDQSWPLYIYMRTVHNRKRNRDRGLYGDVLYVCVCVSGSNDEVSRARALCRCSIKHRGRNRSVDARVISAFVVRTLRCCSCCCCCCCLTLKCVIIGFCCMWFAQKMSARRECRSTASGICVCVRRTRDLLYGVSGARQRASALYSNADAALGSHYIHGRAIV